jgi:hypothetical protein
MPRRIKKNSSKPSKKPIEQYDHKDKKRMNNPPVGLVTAGVSPDYDGRSLYPRQVFFPMADEDEDWAKLARNLKAEIDPELIKAYRGTVSLPFEAGQHKRVAVKIRDDRGIESLKVGEVA